MFNAEECLNFRKFCQEIIFSPRMMEQQEHKREGKYLWCEDWEIIELIKYFFNGKDTYNLDPLPNRLKNNPLFPGREVIIAKGDEMIKAFGTADKIIDQLRRRRNATA